MLVDIGRAAERYVMLVSFEPMLPGRSERRKKLRKVAKLAKELGAELRELDARATNQLFGCGVDEIEVLAVSATEAADLVPRGGGDPKTARIWLVRDLAEVFEANTGERPIRSSDPALNELERWGIFGELVCAVLEPLDPKAIGGLDHVIRDALQARAET